MAFFLFPAAWGPLPLGAVLVGAAGGAAAGYRLVTKPLPVELSAYRVVQTLRTAPTPSDPMSAPSVKIPRHNAMTAAFEKRPLLRQEVERMETLRPRERRRLARRGTRNRWGARRVGTTEPRYRNVEVGRFYVPLGTSEEIIQAAAKQFDVLEEPHPS